MRGLTLIVLSLSIALSAHAQAEIQARIDSLRQSLKDRPITAAEFPNIGSNIEATLKSAADALQAGSPYLSLEKLAQGFDLLYGARAYAEKSASVKSLAEFDAEWRKTESTLALPAANWSRAPAALRAISEAAGVRATPLLEGARGFAAATKPADGIFYLGEAQGEAEFARFCAGLNLDRKGRAIALRSLLPEILALQEKTNAAFQPPRSIDQHPRFIALNSTLKLARELDAAKLYAGAMYQYLEAVRHFGMLDAAPVAPSIVALRRKLEASKDDDSIALIFLQRAAAQATGTEDERKSAGIIAASVIPAYLAARKPAAGLPRAPAKTVEITLVRWPYT
uniref:Chemotaxis protein MotC n=1 Tax=Solibacter usitatus (strain Ellin6076) TaxID=234267 RepID=Q01VR0_SOLUE